VSRVQLRISPVPSWVDPVRWLGRADVSVSPLARSGRGAVELSLSLEAREAAAIVAQLRGLGVDGRPLELTCEPPLSRSLVREGRLLEARARRETTPGFSRAGARATGEGRFSLTPEPLALALGELAAGARVFDACCGSGGNAIGFARTGCRVSALEIDRNRLDEARHNARVFGVQDRIAFEHGDALQVAPQRSADILFVDPPWGEHYDKRTTTRASFPLLDALLRQDLGGYRELWLKVPSSFELASVGADSALPLFGRAAGDHQRIKFVLVRVDPAGVRRLPH
jgi:SAM-dependent methyltransferase